MGRSANSWRTAEARVQSRRVDSLQVHDPTPRTAVADLFQNEKDPIRVIKLKEIYEFLEQTTDYCEDVADALQNVQVKNA